AVDVSFDTPPGITMIFGASGSGKTTVLNCVSGLLKPDRGHIAMDGRVVFDGESQLNIPTVDRNIGYVFQDLPLFPHLSADANIRYGLKGTEQTKRVEEIIRAFRLDH